MELMYSLSEPYTNIKPLRPALTSFAPQLVEKKNLVKVESAIKPSSGLHISFSKNNSRTPATYLVTNNEDFISTAKDAAKQCENSSPKATT